MSDFKATSQYVDFFINDDNDEKPTPIAFFKKFDFLSKRDGVSNWCSALNESLTIHKNDPKLIEIKQNFDNGHYKQSINDYFRKSGCVRLLEKQRVC